MSPLDQPSAELGPKPKARPATSLRTAPFPGFPDRFPYAALPLPFFRTLLPQITDLAELKITLYLLWLLLRKRGYPRFAMETEIQADPVLLTALGGGEAAPEEALHRGLDLAVQRGTFLRIAVEREGQQTSVYLLNTPKERQTLEKIARGELSLAEKVQPLVPVAAEQERATIFALYEQNIGLLNPLIVEELKEAEERYPPRWVEEAFRQAVALNKRNWRYIARILERWATEGKDDGESRRHPGAIDMEKYLLDPYGRPRRR